jgi:hypothetical protein
MRVLLLLILSIGFLPSYGQNTSDASFLQQRKNIDSLAKLIDVNQGYIECHFVGRDSTYGEFTGRYFSNPKDRSICKTEYTFQSDFAGVKIFYYNKDSLIKAHDRKRVLYFIGHALINETGREVKTTDVMYLLLFQKNFKEAAKALMDD